MPHSSDQKAHSRSRIIAAAARLFRERGYVRTSVDDLMAEAGLTRGGFYAHFANKAALFQAALEAAFAQSAENLLGRGLDDVGGEPWLERARQRYLSSAHLESPANGCAIPSLGSEVARAEPSVREAFGSGTDALVSKLAARLGGDPARARARVIRELARWSGALLLARAVSDPTLREEILAACCAPDGEE